MSSSPRRSTPDASFDSDPAMSDPSFGNEEAMDSGAMQDIAISGEIAVDPGGAQADQAASSEPTVLDKSVLRRYPAWITLVVASAIAYASLAVEMPSSNSRIFCFAILGITLVFSIGVSGCFIAPDCNACTKAFVSSGSSTGRFVELVLSMIMFILWCIGLPIIMDPTRGIAIGLTQIVNANLYVTSWICFAAIIFVLGDLMGDLFAGPQGSAYGLSQLDPQTGEYVVTPAFTPVHYQRLWDTRRGKWFALAAITGIALSGTVRTYQAFACGKENMQSNATCKDTKVAIAMNVLGGIFCLSILGLGSMASPLSEFVEKIGAICTTVVWTVGLAVITFGAGPGHSLGNLFFATWGGFYVSIMITADCYRDEITRRAQALSGQTSPFGNPNSTQVEMPEVHNEEDNDI